MSHLELHAHMQIRPGQREGFKGITVYSFLQGFEANAAV
jgi:hypothetical protein